MRSTNCDCAAYVERRYSIPFDERIYLSAEFLFARLQHVIGTLWKINDNLSVQVATFTYKGMIVDCDRIDVRKTAENLLHRSVRQIRDGTRRISGIRREFPDDVLVWVSNIYI